jgi:hypothetical protein
MKKTALLAIAIGLNTPRCAMNAKAAAISGIEAVSSRHMGAPYAIDPLGEGRGIDPDPLSRDDAFDCMTFVETVLARTLGIDLQSIRYKDGRVDFMARNHFVSLDWIENNSGIIEAADTGLPQRVKKTVIDKAKWMKATRGIEADFAPAEASIAYIPSEEILKNEGKIAISEPMLAFFIADDGGMNVSHAGFLLPTGNGKIVLRHASQWYGRVMDIDFFEYIRRVKKHLGAAIYRIKGLRPL